MAESRCRKSLVNYNFNKHTLAEVTRDFHSNVFLVESGSWSVTPEGLNIISNPFTLTTPKGNEHPKNLHYWNNPFKLSDKYETLYEAEICVTQYFPANGLPERFKSRVRNVDEDIRLCSGAINTLDPETWMVADIFLSNQKIYCFVERLPFGRTPENKYGSFSSAVAVIQRPADTKEFVKVAIGLKKSSISFYVEDTLVYHVPILGLRANDEFRVVDHQGDAEVVQVKQSYLGFGLFSLLDMQLPDNYARQLVVNDFDTNQSASGLVQLDSTEIYGETLSKDNRPIVDPEVTWAVPFNPKLNNTNFKLFGQGAEMTLKYFKVSQVFE